MTRQGTDPNDPDTLRPDQCAAMHGVPAPEAGGARVVRKPPREAPEGPAAHRRASPRRTAARGVRRTYYIPPDTAARFDQAVDDLAYELRMPKLDILGAILNRAIEDVGAIRAQFTSLTASPPG